MKHLKSYKIFESLSDIFLDDVLSESLIDLYDDGFTLRTVYSDDSSDGESIRVSLYKQINVNWTGNISIRCSFDKNEINKERVSTLRGSGSSLTKEEKELSDLVYSTSHTIINMIDYKKGYFDIGYSVNVNRNTDINIHIVLEN